MESLGIDVEQTILFGSRSRGNAREDSDIDVVVLSPSFSGKSYWERIDILTEAIYMVHAPIDAVAFTPEEWENENSPVYGYVRNCT